LYSVEVQGIHYRNDFYVSGNNMLTTPRCRTVLKHTKDV